MLALRDVETQNPIYPTWRPKAEPSASGLTADNLESGPAAAGPVSAARQCLNQGPILCGAKVALNDRVGSLRPAGRAALDQNTPFSGRDVNDRSY